MNYPFVFEYSKEINNIISTELLDVFPDADFIEVNSFGADTIIQALVTIVPAMLASSAVTTLITKFIRDKNVTVKYDGIEITGDYKNVDALIDKIEFIKKGKNND